MWALPWSSAARVVAMSKGACLAVKTSPFAWLLSSRPFSMPINLFSSISVNFHSSLFAFVAVLNRYPLRWHPSRPLRKDGTESIDRVRSFVSQLWKYTIYIYNLCIYIIGVVFFQSITAPRGTNTALRRIKWQLIYRVGWKKLSSKGGLQPCRRHVSHQS